MSAMNVPLDYQPGFAKAQLLDAELANRYIMHTQLGDPDADGLMLALQAFDAKKGHIWIQQGIDGGCAALDDAPQVVHDFFAKIETAPAWFDEASTHLGCKAFHRHSEMFVGAFVGGVLIEGFSTLIAKSFSMSGRLTDQGFRRLKQNNRHLLEIFLPGGLQRHGDGWKLSVRIRLVHARMRLLIKQADHWDTAAWGTPLSAAHIAYASASFSGNLLRRARMVGVHLSDEERASFMAVWRYSGYLMGTPEALLFANEAQAMRIHQIGAMCEPDPSLECITMANALINAAPLLLNITEPVARQKLANKIFKISRALIGTELADKLQFPRTRTFGVLATLRWTNALDSWVQNAVPFFKNWRRKSQFLMLMDLSLYQDSKTVRPLPEHVFSEKDRPIDPPPSSN
jgi:hypothetical protein